MHIILGKENLPNIENRYTLLEIDQFKLDPTGLPIQAYCVLENLHLDDLFQLDMRTALHEKLIESYRNQQWSLCEQLIDQLQPAWNGQLESFYNDLSQRIAKYKENDPGADWDYTIHKY